MNKPRKPLHDALADQFVYGVNDSDKPSILDKLQPVESREATKRFTVDLPESMHRKLSILSAKTGRSKADIVRTLLDEILSNFHD